MGRRRVYASRLLGSVLGSRLLAGYRARPEAERAGEGNRRDRDGAADSQKPLRRRTGRITMLRCSGTHDDILEASHEILGQLAVGMRAAGRPSRS